MRHPFWVCLAAAGSICLLALLAGTPSDAQRARPPRPPLGLGEVIWPPDNPYSPEKVELGRLLYFDKRLSADGTVACASCHDPRHAFTDGKPFSTGVRGQVGGRSAPTVINRAYGALHFWDGRAPSLEEQAKGPIANPIEMDLPHDECVKRLRSISGYRERFRRVFGTEEFTIDHVAKAIAAFERTVLSGNSPYDRYKAGDRRALTPEQVRGMQVFFEKAQCQSCHFGFNFTDNQFANLGIGMDKPNPDLGRYLVTRQDRDRGAFKTPTLREIEHTAPYMHDGRFKTLEEVVEFYDKGGIKNPWLDERIKPLNLTPQEKRDLVAFLRALSGEGWQQIKPPTEFPQ